MNRTMTFFKLLGGNRFLRNNEECVKLRHAEPIGCSTADAVTLDKGELIQVEPHEEVIFLSRSY